MLFSAFVKLLFVPCSKVVDLAMVLINNAQGNTFPSSQISKNRSGQPFFVKKNSLAPRFCCTDEYSELLLAHCAKNEPQVSDNGAMQSIS
jgi:hypothetical protein